MEDSSDHTSLSELRKKSVKAIISREGSLMDTRSMTGHGGRRTWKKHFRSLSDQAGFNKEKGEDTIDEFPELDSDSGTWLDEDVESEVTSWLKGGQFRFQSATSIEYIQDYLLINSDTNIEDLGVHMTRVWRLPLPRLILSVISNVDHFTVPSEYIIDDLQMGIFQTARMTKVWILTDGLNTGITSYIGEIVARERMRRRLSPESSIGREGQDSGHIVAIGVMCSDQLRYGKLIEEGSQFTHQNKTLKLENVGDDRHELNPEHSHSLIMSPSDTTDKDPFQTLRFNLEARIAQALSTILQRKDRKSITSLKDSQGPSEKEASAEQRVDGMNVPVVGLVVQGGPGEIERVLWLLKQRIPVIVISRKGFASGLICQAYKEYLLGDIGRIEQILKPRLLSSVKEAFPDCCGDNELQRQQIRDRIIDCAKVAVQSDRQLLFVLDPSSPEDDLKDLNGFILAAIHSAQSGSTMTRENVNWTLKLALRWNRDEFVANKVLNPLYISRYRVRDDLFVEALLLPDRERFVELFLTMGFLLHRLMNYEQVLRLFEASLKEEFFVTICLQRILLKKKVILGSKFMHESSCELNSLLCKVSGLKYLVNPTDLLIPPIVTRTNSNMLERKALLTILYWAVLTNRKNLVKVLWKRSAEPIAVALVISNMYYRMSKFWIRDIDLRREIKNNAIEFGSLAIKVMDLTFNDSRLLAFHSLTNPIPEFNNLNVVDLALLGNNIFFIAHPCCQRSMHERWYGNIKLKSYGRLHVPEFVKIYLCAVLIFPMYFWVSFKPVRQKALKEDNDSEDPKETKSFTARYLSRLRRDGEYTPPNIFMKIYYLWTAPITKFWINQLFVLAYLVLYAIAVMLPYCGDRTVNWVLCIWTLVLILENFTRIAKTIQKFHTINIMWPLAQGMAEVATAVILLIHLLIEYFDFMTYKMLIAFSMLATYFCALSDLLTASPELGPMLVNVTEITRKDMINWLRLWMMFVISGGLTISAVIYPAKPFSVSNMTGALLRAILGLWLTEIDDLKGDKTCTDLYHTSEIINECYVSNISPYSLSRLENCPYSSFFGYVMVIQYIMVSRLVLYTLMFAMFSLTINRTERRSVELWKYQFQSIVTDFETRPVIPAPLNIVTYPFRISIFLGNLAIEVMLECSACCREFKSGKTTTSGIPYNQWKSYMSQITRQEEQKQDKMNDIMMNLEDESSGQQSSIKQLTDHLVHIERHQTMTAVYLEDLKKKLETLDPKIRAHVQQGVAREIHELSRQSPYPGTEIYRFPLLDKDVPWEIAYEAYDPATYSKPIEEFKEEEREGVDVDILSLPMVGGQYQTTLQTADIEGNVDPNSRVLQIDVLHNKRQSLMLRTGYEVYIDRTSYLTQNDQPLQYDLDKSGLPINPMGRTGLRGRGLLPRWGPNHWIKAVISRPTTRSSEAASTSRTSVTMESPPEGLEILVKSSLDGASLSLIGGPEQLGKTTYCTLCDVLMSIFPDDTANHGHNAEQEEMIHVFSKFASHFYKEKRKAGYATYGYSAFLVYRGYDDSPVNTDNAWQESEIFNFHYKYKDCFGTRPKMDDTVGWQEVTETMPLSPCEMAAVRAAAKIRNRTAWF